MKIVTLKSKKYPSPLKQVGSDAPKQLYYKGSWDEAIFLNCLAVVGSRQITAYGRQTTEKIVGEAAAAGLTIVSGFMYGIDAAAHKAAVRVSGRTIAVMPCGIDIIHPEYQQDLYAEILDNKGLVVSEYEGSFLPTHWSYPQRNRIVAGLSKAVLVVEAGEKSGSLITANLAKKYKRKVFVVPNPITSENSKGIMKLIKEGAVPVSSAEDILKYFKVKGLFKSPQKSAKTGDDVETKILEQLKRESSDIDYLARIFGLPASKIGSTLSLMQLKGLIKQDGNKYYLP